MRLPTQTVIQMYQDNLFRIAFSICQNREDAEDVVQETFLRYHSGAVDFNDEMHIRAWLIRVTINQSKNMLRTFRCKFHCRNGFSESGSPGIKVLQPIFHKRVVLQISLYRIEFHHTV